MNVSGAGGKFKLHAAAWQTRAEMQDLAVCFWGPCYGLGFRV